MKKNRDYMLWLAYCWIQFFILLAIFWLVLFLLAGCRCGIVTTDDIFFLGCGIGTEPVGVLESEPNRLSVDYTGKPQRVRAVYPPFGIETQ